VAAADAVRTPRKGGLTWTPSARHRRATTPRPARAALVASTPSYAAGRSVTCRSAWPASRRA